MTAHAMLAGLLFCRPEDLQISLRQDQAFWHLQHPILTVSWHPQTISTVGSIRCTFNAISGKAPNSKVLAVYATQQPRAADLLLSANNLILSYCL